MSPDSYRDTMEGDWKEWGNHVLTELKRNSDAIHKLASAVQTQQLEYFKALTEHKLECQKKASELDAQVRELKVKAATIAAVIGTAAPVIVEIVKALL